jgi:hypothetical protein
MSEFDDAMEEAYGASLDVLGTEELVISGDPFAAPLKVRGIVNEVGTTEELTTNGRKITYSVVVQCAASEFRQVCPLEPKAGQTVLRKKTGKTYRIVGQVHRDTLAFTFPLDTIQK